MTEATSHRILRTVEIILALCVVAYLVHVWENKKESPTITVEKQRDSSNIIIVNPTPSQTIPSKEPVFIPPNYDDLVKAFLEAVKQRDEVNKYDSTVYVMHDTDTTAIVPYHITTKGKLLDFRMNPTIISTKTTITKNLSYQINASLGLHTYTDKVSVSANVGYMTPKVLYEVGHDINGKGWHFKVGIPLITKYK